MVSISYLLHRTFGIILSKGFLFNFYLNLEWIATRLANETSFRIYTPENHHPCRKETNKFILKHISASDAVLDLGCGSGSMSDYLADNAKEVTGIDSNKSAIELARKTFKRDNLTFIHRDVMDYLNTSESKKHDLIIACHIIEHLNNPKDFFAFCKNYNKLFIELPDFDSTYLNTYRIDQNNDLFYSDNDHVNEFVREDIIELIKENELEIFAEEYRYGVMKIWCRPKSGQA